MSDTSLEDRSALLEALEARRYVEARDDIEKFAEMVEIPGAPVDLNDNPYAPKLELAKHHRLILRSAKELIDSTDINDLVIMMPPGSAKSTIGSVVVAAWALGRRPGTNVIMCTYGQDLTLRFARRTRQMCRDPEYQKIMGCSVVGDNQAVEQWSLDNGSDYRAAALGSAITGMRGSLIICDDLVKDRESADSALMRDKTWEAYVDNISTRLRPNAKMIFIGTRWHQDDYIGRLVSEEWVGQSGLWRSKATGRLMRIINLPMLAEHKDDPLGRLPGQMLWEEYLDRDDVMRRKAAAESGNVAASRSWSALYQCRPAPNEGAILSRHYWQKWTKKDLPEVKAVYLFYDTAFEEGEENDYSAMTAWGVFDHTSKKPGGEEYNHTHMILLGAWEEKVNAVDLIDEVLAHCKLFRPDRIMVEKRASGVQLIQEMRRRRLPVKEWLPRGKPGAKGKVPRAHAIAAILEQGSCWYVPGVKTERVLDQCAAFPFGTNDDLVDTVTMAIAYCRDKHLFQTADDELDLEEMKEKLAQQAEAKKRGRRLYGGGQPSGLLVDPIESDDVENMTEETKRRLYG